MSDSPRWYHAAEMKLLWALLLLGCVLAVHGGATTRRKSRCRQGLAALEVFAEHRGCDRGPFDVLEDLMTGIDGNVTVSSLSHLFSYHCSTVLPSMVRCFAGNIRRCSRSQRNSLRRVARQTGFVCRPNSNRINPVIRHILTRLSDADFAENEACNSNVLIQINEFCYNRSLEVIGTSPANLNTFLMNHNMAQLAPKMQRLYRTATICLVTLIRGNLRNCPQWRGKAMKAVTVYVLPTVLGNSMTLTIAEINRLFRW